MFNLPVLRDLTQNDHNLKTKDLALALKAQDLILGDQEPKDLDLDLKDLTQRDQSLDLRDQSQDLKGLDQNLGNQKGLDQNPKKIEASHHLRNKQILMTRVRMKRPLMSF